MSYIQNNLQAGEEIKYKADIHWYIFAYPGNTTIIKRLLFFRTNRIILLCQHTSIVVRIIPIDKKNSS